MELIIRISRLVQVIMFPNVCRLRRNRKTLFGAPKRRGLRSAYALARTPVAFDGPIFALANIAALPGKTVFVAAHRAKAREFATLRLRVENGVMREMR